MAELVTKKEKTFMDWLMQQAGAAIDRMAGKKKPPLEPVPLPMPEAKLSLSPPLEKNKYHDAFLDLVADIAVEVGAPLDILVELHSDHRVKGYVIQLYREATPLERVSFRIPIEDMVVIEPAQLRPQVLEALTKLTGKTYVPKHPILAMPAPVGFPLPPKKVNPAPWYTPTGHSAECVCKKCQQARKAAPQAGPVPAGQRDPDVPLAKRYIDPTKSIDMGDRVLDLE